MSDKVTEFRQAFDSAFKQVAALKIRYAKPTNNGVEVSERYVLPLAPVAENHGNFIAPTFDISLHHQAEQLRNHGLQPDPKMACPYRTFRIDRVQDILEVRPITDAFPYLDTVLTLFPEVRKNYQARNG